MPICVRISFGMMIPEELPIFRTGARIGHHL
jgi:hypothetical protein